VHHRKENHTPVPYLAFSYELAFDHYLNLKNPAKRVLLSMESELSNIADWDTFIQKVKDIEKSGLEAHNFQVWKQCLDWITKRSQLDNDPVQLQVH
jgi:hypothetical protein